MKTIAILQSNYIPWKGYFDIVAAVDEFLIFDEVQFTRRDWRNRNKIVIDGALHWLTIPVASKGNYHAPISEIEVSEAGWAEKHWRSIKHAYRKAPFFPSYEAFFQKLYERAAEFRLLTEINELFLREIAAALGLSADIQRTSSIGRRAESPTGRLVEICVARNAGAYVSGPAAKSYIRPEEFTAAGVRLFYANYAGYPPYDQASGSFEPGVSIIDTLMRCGPDTRNHLKSVGSSGDLLKDP